MGYSTNRHTDPSSPSSRSLSAPCPQMRKRASFDALFAETVRLLIGGLVAHQGFKAVQNLGTLAAEQGQVLLHQDGGVIAQLHTLQRGLHQLQAVFLVDFGQHPQVVIIAEQPLYEVLGGLHVVRVLEHDFGIKLKDYASFVAGHSLGEYSAACAAGVFSLTDTAKLLRTRGDAMQKAVPVGVGGMAAVIGAEYAKVAALAKACSDNGKYVCVAANDNADGQVVLSGHMEAIDKAVELASEFGAKRCVKLPVSAPFHSPLMEPAAEVMAKALAQTQANAPQIPLISNVTAQPVTSAEDVINNLICQVTGSVRWRESVNLMVNQGIHSVIELGAGKVLSGIVKRSHKEINTASAGTVAEIEELAASLTK